MSYCSVWDWLAVMLIYDFRVLDQIVTQGFVGKLAGRPRAGGAASRGRVLFCHEREGRHLAGGVCMRV